MRILAGLLTALALAAPLRAETVTAPPGCTALATLVYQDCSVALVSSCSGMPPTHRVYEYYRDGKASSRSVQEDGVFTLVAAAPGLHRTFSSSSDLLEKLLKQGEGTELTHRFTSETRQSEGVEHREGVMVVRHMGFEPYRLGNSNVSVLRLEVDGKTDDGTVVNTTRHLDLETGIMLALTGVETAPGGGVRPFSHRATALLLPGEPGFGEVDDPPSGTCGSAS